MSTTPFLPLAVPDFVADTMEMDAKEVGAYMLLLMSLWQRKGYLPNNHRKLKRVARIGRDWPKVWGALEEHFEVDGDRIFNTKLLAIVTRVADQRTVNAHSGALGGRAKALKEKNTRLANATISAQQLEPEPEEKEIYKENEFLEWWASCPKQSNQEGCQKLYLDIVNTETASPAKLLSAMRGYAGKCEDERREQKFIKNPKKWLEEKCWRDVSKGNPKPPTDEDRIQSWVGAFTNGKYLSRDSVSQAMVNEMLVRNLITTEQATAKGYCAGGYA